MEKPEVTGGENKVRTLKQIHAYTVIAGCFHLENVSGNSKGGLVYFLLYVKEDGLQFYFPCKNKMTFMPLTQE